MATHHSILQWNCRGLRTNLCDLQILIQNNHPSVICLQETKITDQNYKPLTSYNHIFKLATPTNTLPKGGTSLFIHKQIPTSTITLNTPLQAVAVRATIHIPVSICTIYIPPRFKYTAQQLSDIINQLPPPFVLLGDFNAHHTLWGNNHTDQAGREIELLLTNSNVCLLNNKCHTYIHPATGHTSSIDLSIVSPSIFQDFQWKTLSDTHGSDHFPILLTPNTHPQSTQTSNWALKRADWTRYEELCKKQILRSAIVQSQDPILDLTTALVQIANQTIPKTSNRITNPAKPWFNKDIKESISTRRKALRRLQTQPTTENINNFNSIKAKTRRLIRQCKRDSWVNYVNQINTRTPISKIWQMIGKISGKKSPPPRSHLKTSNQLITDGKSIANTLAETFAHNSSTNNYSPAFQNYRQQVENTPIDFSSNNQEDYNEPLTLTELNRALQQSHDSAVGPDEIHYQLLRHLPEDIKSILLEAYNHHWQNNTFPTPWQHATILPFQKPGKSPENPSNYRPIALTSCLCKVMERIINNRLVWYLEHHNILNPYQSGFRKGHSTNDHLIRLESFIRNSFQAKQHVTAVFFDLEKAYETTWRYGCLADLQKAGLKGHLPKFIANFLSDRQFQVRSGSTLSDIFTQEMGVPQGSIISVTLFGLRINDIVKSLTPHIHCCLYVDDFTIFIQTKTISEAEQELQKTINNLQNWCEINGFKFSPSKSECILFHRPRSRPQNPNLILNGTKIPVKTQVKFLGIIFDSKLSFIPHILHLKDKCLKALNIIKVTSHHKWGGDQQTLLNLYRAIIRSKLDYGCAVYGSARPSYLRMLDPVINQALRLCLGAYRTSPKESLQIEAGETPMTLRHTQLALQYVIKTAANSSLPTYNTLFHTNISTTKSNLIQPLSSRIASSIHHILPNPSIVHPITPFPLPPWHLIPPTVILDKELMTNKTTTSSHVLCSRFLEIRQQYRKHQAIFTDGSKVGQKVGAAAIIPPHTLQQRLPDNSSIFSAETRAILMALSHISTQSPQQDSIIFSDSQSVLIAIASSSNDNPLIADILLHLHNISTNVIFCWVPSHIGIQGNELADQAAKAALDLPNSSLTVPSSDFRPIIRQHIINTWQQAWNNSQSKLHHIQPKIPATTRLNHPNLNRHDQITISRLRIGHTRLTHSYLLEGKPPPTCIPCNSPLTVQHLLIDCLDFQPTRDRHYSANNLKELFSSCRLSKIIDFLKEINLYYKI